MLKIHTTQQIEYEDGSLSAAITSTREVEASPPDLNITVRGLAGQADHFYERYDKESNTITLVVKELPIMLAFVPTFTYDPRVEALTIYAEVSDDLMPYWQEQLGGIGGGTLNITDRITIQNGGLAFAAVSSTGAVSRKIRYHIDAYNASTPALAKW